MVIYTSVENWVEYHRFLQSWRTTLHVVPLSQNEYISYNSQRKFQMHFCLWLTHLYHIWCSFLSSFSNFLPVNMMSALSNLLNSVPVVNHLQESWDNPSTSIQRSLLYFIILAILKWICSVYSLEQNACRICEFRVGTSVDSVCHHWWLISRCMIVVCSSPRIQDL